MEIVGIAADTRSVALWDADEPFLYLPLALKDRAAANILIRTAQPTVSLRPAVAGAVKSIEQGLEPLIGTLDEQIERWLWPSKIGAILAAALGALATVLAMLGLYGLMAYSLSQRTREIAIRMALGANRNNLLRSLIQQGMKLVAIGIMIGLGVCILIVRILSKFLYGIGAADLWMLASIPLLLSAIALCAVYIPARRATAVDPIVALKEI